jgi:RNA polymerase sigma-70 factor (ECF subfamily)
MSDLGGEIRLVRVELSMTKHIHRDAIVPAAPSVALETTVAAHCQQAQFDRATQLLLRAFAAEIRGFLRARTRHRTSLEDTYALFCEDVWRGLPGYRFEGRLRAWLFTLARHALARHVKSKQRWRERHVSDDFESTALSVRHSLALKNDRLARLPALLAELSEADRQLVEQRLLHALPWREIANASGDPDVTRASARLRKRFQVLVRALRVRAATRRSIA